MSRNRGAIDFGQGQGPEVLAVCASGGSLFDVPEDLDYEGVVDGNDVGIVLAGWGGPGWADLDGKGTIDGRDLGIVLSARSAPTP